MGSRLRPVDLAREVGLSTQAVRNYEDAGILPPAQRTATGYRVYTPLHANALRVFAALVPAHGHPGATAVMRAVNRDEIGLALTLLDESHTELLKDRRTLAAVEEALHALVPASLGAEQARSVSAIGPLARELRLRPATLRKWERAGLIRPRRDASTGYRVFTPDDVRDARLAHQLRRGGYPLNKIAELLEQVRAAGGVEPLASALGEWHARLTRRGIAMLAAAAQLHSYLDARALACGQPTISGFAHHPSVPSA